MTNLCWIESFQSICDVVMVYGVLFQTATCGLCLSVCQSIWLSLFVCLSVCLSVFPSVFDAMMVYGVPFELLFVLVYYHLLTFIFLD